MVRCTCPEPEDELCGCSNYSFSETSTFTEGDGGTSTLSVLSWGVRAPFFEALVLGNPFFNSFSKYTGSVYHGPEGFVFDDWVFLRGRLLKSGAPAVGQQILSDLEVQFRPSKRVQLVCATTGGDNSYIEIRPDGTMWCQSSQGGTWLQLDGLHYTL